MIAIGELIRADSPQRAISFIFELERKAYSIARRPPIYRLRPEIAPDVRLAVHGNYVILFRMETVWFAFSTSSTVLAI
jgi:toxin ParE1/3/4